MGWSADLPELVADGTLPTGVGISWVTIERWAREKASSASPDRPFRADAESLTDAQLLDKLRDFGIDLDRAGLQALCAAASSAEEVASGLLSEHLSTEQQGRQDADWIWLAVLALWQRWWPAKPCLETIDDKIQEGYEQLPHDQGAATDRWLEAWAQVVSLCDASGVTTIAEFDEQFPMTQSLFNWNQDLEMALGNAGLDDPAKLRDRDAIAEWLRQSRPEK